MELQIFQNPRFGQLRTVIINGEVYFVGKDVATALGYSNTRDALAKHVEPEDKKNVDLNSVANCDPINDAVSKGWIKNEVTVINESGLYSLILSSKLPQAKDFKRWVTAEVLPSIRKYGVYSTKEFAKKAISNPKWAIDILLELQAEQEKVAILTEENAVLNQQVAELTPKASYYDVVLNCKDLVSVSKIAKDYGFSAVKFNRLLHKLGVQYKQGTIWLLYQKYANLGWTSTKTHIYLNDSGETQSCVLTCWTPKGRLGLYDLLKSKGYLPLIEQDEQDELYEEC